MRIRAQFTKTGALIYIGNLDLYTMWERACRRAGLPLAYSQGFHPQPKIHFAAPLPLGYSSRCEIVDLKLNEPIECEQVCERLNAALPPDIRVLDVQEIDEGAPAVQTQVLSAEYDIHLRDPVEEADLVRRADEILRAEQLPRERRGRHYDLRPLIEALEVESALPPVGAKLRMRLKAQEGATGRPDEVLAALGIAREGARIERTGLLLRSANGLEPALKA